MSDRRPTGGPAARSRRRLARALRERRDDLVRRWTERVLADPRVPDAGKLTEPELHDHVPDLVADLARLIENEGAGEEQERTIGFGDKAREHARQRAGKGYGTAESLRELSHLRAVILELYVEEKILPGASGVTTLHLALDEVMMAGLQEMERLARRSEAERAQLLESERAARCEAERAAHQRDEFVALLSHELRSPLNAILGWTGMLRSGKLGPEAHAKALQVVERNARAQAELVEDLLDLSRITSGKLRLDVRCVDVPAMIENTVASHLPAASAKGVRLSKVHETPGCSIRGDPARIEQILSNLISNAVKFTPAGGEVLVRCCSTGTHVELSVHDTGQGISREFLPHVFDRFRQADSSLTRRHRGLGLGLSLVKSLVEQHGGEVRAESAGEGKGATFTVTFPTAAASRVCPRPVDACESLAGLRILVVDDEEDARALLCRILEDCNAEVTAARSASEALYAVQRMRPDVLISDISMPEIDGYQLLRAVRALGPDRGGAVPAVAVTAFVRPEERAQALAAGYQVHLAKPVDRADLLTAVAELSGRLATAA